MTEKNFKISGMSCMHCVMAVKKELSKLDVASIEVEIGFAKIKFDESKVEPSTIERAIAEAGFEVVK